LDVTAPAPILASDTAFVVVFGVFIVALVILVAVTVRWAVRHDRSGWRAWRARQFPTARPSDRVPPSVGENGRSQPRPPGDPGSRP
jgi:hypothetical protein